MDTASIPGAGLGTGDLADFPLDTSAVPGGGLGAGDGFTATPYPGLAGLPGTAAGLGSTDLSSAGLPNAGSLLAGSQSPFGELTDPAQYPGDLGLGAGTGAGDLGLGGIPAGVDLESPALGTAGLPSGLSLESPAVGGAAGAAAGGMPYMPGMGGMGSGAGGAQSAAVEPPDAAGLLDASGEPWSEDQTDAALFEAVGGVAAAAGPGTGLHLPGSDDPAVPWMSQPVVLSMTGGADQTGSRAAEREKRGSADGPVEEADQALFTEAADWDGDHASADGFPTSAPPAAPASSPASPVGGYAAAAAAGAALAAAAAGKADTARSTARSTARTAAAAGEEAEDMAAWDRMDGPLTSFLTGGAARDEEAGRTRSGAGEEDVQVWGGDEATATAEEAGAAAEVSARATWRRDRPSAALPRAAAVSNAPGPLCYDAPPEPEEGQTDPAEDDDEEEKEKKRGFADLLVQPQHLWGSTETDDELG
ncbi:hypothetical protein [Streptomyces sp. NPDC005498]|uniref:hypothetical protein n=1 Tax=Streptomyces sp. NPDC005498 TaxID=3364717 RepID=UPI0036A697A3